MKNIFKFFGTILTVVLAAALTGCSLDEQLESADLGLHVKVFFPTKVVEGQPMTINGSGFTEVTEIVFPGDVVVTDFQIVSNDMIRVDAPAGIAAEGGKIVVRTAEKEAESPLPLTLGCTKISGYSVEAGTTVDGGSQITIYGTDLEFINGIELLDADGNPALIEDKAFNKKATASIIFTVPKKVYEGTFVGKVYTIDGKTFEMPELTYKPATDGGYFETVETIIWENDGSIGAAGWDNTYRFALEGTNGGDASVDVPADLWALMKNGPFHVKIQPVADWWQIRILTGHWQAQWPTADDSGNGDVNVNWTDIVVDNGDGTFTVTLDFTGHGILEVMDEQNLLFAGSGFQILKIYTSEEVWVPGGAVEIVRTSIWKNDGSVGAAAWSGSPYRFGMEGMDGNNECVATIAPDVWEKMKTTPFKVQVQPATEGGAWQIRVLDGWWSVGNDASGALDFTASSEGMVDNGDGTFTFELDVKTHPSPDTPLVDIIDAQHLLFAGDGFIISELYWEEEVLVPGGGGQPAEVVVWENDGSFPSCNWGGHYRFGLEGMDSLNECAATFPADVWERLKSAPFNILIEPVGDWFSIRVMDGWWSVGNDQSGARDLTPNTEGVVNNGDGTWVVPISLPEDLLPVLDAQHLLFSGGEYTILKIYYYE